MVGELRENGKSCSANRGRGGVARGVGRFPTISRRSRIRLGRSVDPPGAPFRELIAARESPKLGDFGASEEGREIARKRAISSRD